MAAIALFRGRMHVMDWCNDELLEFAGRDGRGMPVSEAFPETMFAPVQAAMDEVFVTGATITMPRPHGLLVLGPRFDARGRIAGVASYYEPAPVTSRPRATPLELVRRLGPVVVAALNGWPLSGP